MFTSLVGLGVALVLSSTVSAVAVPIPVPQDDTSTQPVAVSILCAALTTSPMPSACLTTAATTTPSGDSTTGATTTTDPDSETTTTEAGSETTAAGALDTTISAAPACTSGAVPNDSTANCWGDMGLEDYVTKWWDANQDSCDNTATNGGDRSFANCWFKLMVPAESPTNCDVLNTGTNCAKPSWKDFSGANMEANFWVTWSLYNVNQWWTLMNEAIHDAEGTVGDTVGAVVTAFNPPKPPETPNWEYLLDAVAFATSLWAEGSEIQKALVRVIPQTATLVPKVYPAGEVEGTVEEWADVGKELAKFIQQWADSIGEAVPLTLNDVEAFARTAGAGQMTAGVYDLSGLTSSITLMTGTLMTSIAAAVTQFIITRTAGQNIADYQSSNELLWDPGCGDGYNSKGVCGGFWYDGTDTWSLTSQQKWQMDTSDIMNVVFGGDIPIADPKLFFQGSLACSTTDDNKNGEAKPSLDSADPNTFSCVASNRVCTYNWDIMNEDFVDSEPFLPNCGPDDLPNIFSFKCGASSSNTGTCLPYNYFAPLMLSSTSTSGSKNCHEKCGGGSVDPNTHE